LTFCIAASWATVAGRDDSTDPADEAGKTGLDNVVFTPPGNRGGVFVHIGRLR